ncbi:hypothetical protein [Thermosynechococcus sp. NK55a]|uniref:hypothetical protein n=1 Tax=Thermosynechococcus sp. NK55a TaxID=1394889 RepID=UPI00138AD6BC|nr:hypothetical protein [Thermosynechococcus sp. NK55a]
MANLSSLPTLDFLLSEVRRSLWRGGWLNGAAVIAVAVTLFILVGAGKCPTSSAPVSSPLAIA